MQEQELAFAILCVDDEKIVLNSLRTQLKRLFATRNYEIFFAESSEEALEILDELEEEGRSLALIVSDQIMPGMKGDELLVQIHQKLPETLKILLTGQTNFEAVQNAINNANLYRFINKPWDPEDFLLTVQQACNNYEQKVKLHSFDQQIQLLHILNSASREMSVEVDLEELCKKLLDNIEKFLKPDLIELVLEREDSPDKFYSTYRTNISAEAERIKDSTARNMRKTYCEHFVFDALNDLTPLDPYKEASLLYIGLPYSKSDGYHGFLKLVYFNPKNKFTHKELEILGVLTSQAALSIENSKLFSKLNTTVQDISDSINYAKRIQFSLLSSKDLLKKRFNESFIFYRPRNVVSGDFYWFSEIKDYFFIAVVDCTGHGVPGAFMSILGNSEISRIVNDLGVYETNEILTFLHKVVKTNLDTRMSSSNGQSNAMILDGMDVSLCRICLKTNEIQYSGANRPLILKNQEGFMEYITDKVSIGPSNTVQEVFNTITIPFQEGDCLFLFSDGITDQFGGQNDRKLTKKRLFEFLHSINSLDFDTQGDKFTEFMSNWMQTHSQTDDMTLLGLRF